MFRYTTVGLGLLVVARAHASFDLILTYDAATQAVHRIDPISKAYLGSFAVPGPSAMKASFVQKSLYLAYGYRASVFDYSTGEERVGRNIYVSSSIYSMALSPDQSTLYLGLASGGIVAYNAATSALIGTVASVTRADAMTTLPDGRLLVLDGGATGHTMKLLTAAGVLQSSYASDSSTSFVSNSIAYWNNPTAPQENFFYRGTQTGSNYQYGSLNHGSSTLIGPAASSYTGYSNLSFHEAGHTGGYFMGVDSTTSNGLRITRFSSDGYQVSTGTYSQILSPTQTAIVLAPEPASFAALGLGCIAFLRRRRK